MMRAQRSIGQSGPVGAGQHPGVVVPVGHHRIRGPAAHGPLLLKALCDSTAVQYSLLPLGGQVPRAVCARPLLRLGMPNKKTAPLSASPLAFFFSTTCAHASHSTSHTRRAKRTRLHPSPVRSPFHPPLPPGHRTTGPQCPSVGVLYCLPTNLCPHLLLFWPGQPSRASRSCGA